MRISLHHQPLSLRTNFISAKLSPGDEELLLRGKSVDVGWPRLSLQRFLICKECNLRTAQIPDALSQNQLAVVMNVLLNVVMIELIGDAGSPRLEILQIGIRPPVSQSSEKIILSAFIVETV